MSSDKDPLVSERSGTVREVGNHAIWSLSSCKPGFGIDQLRDDCMDTYWQSDGQLPHLVNIQFQRKTMVSHIYIYTDYKLDESYTPSRISIRAGTHFNDLQEIEVIELIEPNVFKIPKSISTTKFNFLPVTIVPSTAIRVTTCYTWNSPGSLKELPDKDFDKAMKEWLYDIMMGGDTDQRHTRQAHKNLHDPDSCAKQPPKWKRHTHEAD